MQKIILFALAMIFIAIAANADTTYVCSQVGD